VRAWVNARAAPGSAEISRTQAPSTATHPSDTPPLLLLLLLMMMMMMMLVQTSAGMQCTDSTQPTVNALST